MVKEASAKLALEIGGDWMSLLPYSLYKAKNAHCISSFISFEILYVRFPPMILNLQSEILAKYDQQTFLNFLEVPHRVQKHRSNCGLPYARFMSLSCPFSTSPTPTSSLDMGTQHNPDHANSS